MMKDDFKLLRGFADGQTDRQMNKWIMVIVESLLRLKTFIYLFLGKSLQQDISEDMNLNKGKNFEYLNL